MASLEGLDELSTRLNRQWALTNTELVWWSHLRIQDRMIFGNGHAASSSRNFSLATSFKFLMVPSGANRDGYLAEDLWTWLGHSRTAIDLAKCESILANVDNFRVNIKVDVWLESLDSHDLQLWRWISRVHRSASCTRFFFFVFVLPLLRRHALLSLANTMKPGAPNLQMVVPLR